MDDFTDGFMIACLLVLGISSFMITRQQEKRIAYLEKQLDLHVSRETQKTSLVKKHDENG